jgi:outer membrane protein TolC
MFSPLIRHLKQKGGFLTLAPTLTAIGLMVLMAPSAHGQQYETVEDAIHQNPTVQRERAAVCQARSRYDLARAGQLPRVDLSVSGGSPLKSRFTRPSRRSFFSTNNNEAAIDRRFDNNNIDGVVRLTQPIYDGQQAEMGKRIAENQGAVARLSVSIETDTVAADILTVALEYHLQLKLKEHFEKQRTELEVLTNRIKERVDLGAGRVSDLRESRLMELELEVAQSQAERQLELLERELQARFKLKPEHMLPFLDRYLSLRGDEVLVEASEAIRSIKRLDLDLQTIDFEKRQLTGERRPNVTAHLDTTLYDVDSFSYEYEMVGRLQLTMPIYDGGSNQARKNENEWRRRGLLSERAGLIRSHSSRTQQAISDHHQATEALKEIDAQLLEMTQRFDTLEAREGQTQSDPLALARLINEIAQAKAGRINQELNLELSLLQGIFFADQLGQLLDLNAGEPTC